VLSWQDARPVARLAEAEEASALPDRFRLELGLDDVRDAAEAPRRGREEQRPERRVEEVVGDVEEARRRGGGAEALVEAVGDGRHWSSFLRRRRIPEEVACRAASAFEPRAAPMSS